VRIAKFSKEQDGYERHRTRPVPVSWPGPMGRPDATIRWRQKISKVVFGFKRGLKIFWKPVEG